MTDPQKAALAAAMLEQTDRHVRLMAAAELSARIARAMNELWLKNYPILSTSKAAGDAECERRLLKGKD